jgi:dienelactone hydrolase
MVDKTVPNIRKICRKVNADASASIQITYEQSYRGPLTLTIPPGKKPPTEINGIAAAKKKRMKDEKSRRRNMRSFTVVALLLGFSLVSRAELVRENVEYRQGDVTLKGYFVYDEAMIGKRPGVLVVHEWWGLNDYARRRADELAQLGYLALACDIYGNGQTAANPEAARALVMPFYTDRALLRARVRAGLDELRGYVQCDTNRVAAVGYCFGGMTVLELARSGAPVAGVVSFHGGLSTPHPEDAKNIKGKVLVLHGGDDPNVKPEEVTAFEDEMRKAGVDWQLIVYGGAAHSFTNPASGSDPSKGAAYNEKADRRSWEAMRAFLAEIFR